MNPIWIVALVGIVVVLVGCAGGVLAVGSRRRNRRRAAEGHAPPLPRDRDTVNGGVIRGDPGQTNTPPGER